MGNSITTGPDTLFRTGASTLTITDAFGTVYFDDTAVYKDFVDMLAGNDTVVGGHRVDVTVDVSDAANVAIVSGGDTIDGGDDDDLIVGDSWLIVTVASGTWNLSSTYGSDLLYGGGGNDVIYADNLIVGDAPSIHGEDFLNLDTVYGGDGNDIVYGGGGSDFIYGDAGNDTLYSAGGGGHTFGGSDNDLILGSVGSDVIAGEDGNDSLFGGSDTIGDSLLGGDGNDFLSGGDDDYILGGDGNDVITYAHNAYAFFGGEGRDRVAGMTEAEYLAFDFAAHEFELGTVVETVNGTNPRDAVRIATTYVFATGTGGNSKAQVHSVVTDFLDGSREAGLADTFDDYLWTNRTTAFDGSGLRVSSTTIWETGMITVAGFDASGARTSLTTTDSYEDIRGWSSRSLTFAEGAMVTRTTDWDNGTVEAETFGGGQLTSRTITDGAGDRFDWVSKTESYTGGVLDRVEYEMDDGLEITEVYVGGVLNTVYTNDLADIHDWQSREDIYEYGTIAHTSYVWDPEIS